MNFGDLFDFYKDSNEEKVAKVKKKLDELYNKDIYVVLDVLDPRVNHFYCYGDVDDFSKLVDLFPNAEVENDKLTVHGRVGFTFYKVADDKRQELIDQNQKAFEERKQKDKDEGVIY